MDPRYPIGRFEHAGEITEAEVAGWIEDIETLPARLREAVRDLTDEQLDTRYREEGWTLRQVVSHLLDSHLNAFVRFKLALTEEQPVIRTYDEARWAELADVRSVPVEETLELLERLHARWCVLLRSLTPQELARRFVHPDDGVIRVARYIGNYAWHGRHHLAHVTTTVERRGWRRAAS